MRDFGECQSPAHASSPEQRLRLYEIDGVEALSEPAVDRRNQVARFGPPTLFASQSSEARRGAQPVSLAF